MKSRIQCCSKCKIAGHNSRSCPNPNFKRWFRPAGSENTAASGLTGDLAGELVGNGMLEQTNRESWSSLNNRRIEKSQRSANLRLESVNLLRGIWTADEDSSSEADEQQPLYQQSTPTNSVTLLNLKIARQLRATSKKKAAALAGITPDAVNDDAKSYKVSEQPLLLAMSAFITYHLCRMLWNRTWCSTRVLFASTNAVCHL